MDIAEHQGNNYLVVIDYYSRWLEVFKIYNKTSSSIISKLKELFSRFGIPKVVIADNVPFSSYEFKQFAKSWNFEVETTSPYHPKSNGLAEKAVGITKNMLKKSKENKQDIELYLLNYRNSPVANLPFTPSQLLNSRNMRSKIPIDFQHLKPKIVPDDAYTLMQRNQERQKINYDIAASKNELSFVEGEKVLVQDIKSLNWIKGEIVKVLKQPRSYLVKTINENTFRRNTIHIRKLKNGDVI
jgi:hypothetical protein